MHQNFIKNIYVNAYTYFLFSITYFKTTCHLTYFHHLKTWLKVQFGLFVISTLENRQNKGNAKVNHPLEALLE